MDRRNLIISFSGGATSAYMAKKLLKSEKYKDWNKHLVYANTGKEKPETLQFIKDCCDYWNIKVTWVEAVVHKDKGIGTTYRVVDFYTASRNGEPFDAVHAKYGLSCRHQPHCTRELKEVPIRKWCQDNFGNNYSMAIGIRIDERQRLNMRRAKQYKWIYPMCFDFPTIKRDVKDFWNQQPFRLNLKNYQGNCDLCWKKSQKKRLIILAEQPSIADWWMEQETKYGDDFVFDRDGLTIAQLLAKSQTENIQDYLKDDEEFFCSCFSNIQFD